MDIKGVQYTNERVLTWFKYVYISVYKKELDNISPLLTEAKREADE